MSYDEEMPLPLRRAIDAELDLADVVPETPTQERQCAEFFAWLAVRSIAPRALRRAGYDALAADCENQPIPSNGGSACSIAQHAIGTQYACSLEPPLAALAYDASAHASTAAFYAGHEDIAVVTQTGCFCAYALLHGSFYDYDIDMVEASWLWDFAVTAINTAVTPRRNRQAESVSI